MAAPKRATVVVCLCLAAGLHAQSAVAWSGYAHDAQHTGLSTIGAQRLEKIKWSTSIDLVLQNTSGTLYIHYGTPLVTAANTVLLPVRTSSSNTYRVEAHSGANGALLYSLSTDYSPPPYDWIPSYSPVLSQGTRLYYPGAGGTVYYRDQPDSASGNSGQIAFYGNALYSANQAAFASSVMISTPIAADASGNIYFGFDVTGSNPANLTSGLARIGADGTGSWISASAAAQGDTSIVEVAMNCAPAVSKDGSTLYFGVSGGPVGYSSSAGYLVAVNSTTLAPVARVRLIDPSNGNNAEVLDASSASPTVGPDGDVYYGVFESQCCLNDDRGWLLHFNSTLTQSKTPGLFGWDTTPSIVPASLVTSYTGSSSYLLFTKYNNYSNIGPGGNGHNKVAVLDPNATETDPVTGATVMQEVIAILGPTLYPAGNSNGSVREWCINSGAIDQFSKSAMVNSEDGTIYRWSFASNSLIQQVTLTAGVGEAYTPTAIGADGTVYALNDANLFAVGQASSPAISSSHTGDFVQAQSGATYTLTVTNSGSAATNGIVTVTDTLPASLTATAIGGTGWACTQPAGPCTRSDVLLASASYQAITLTVNVAGNAPSTVTNTATVSSDGAVNTVNSTANDVTGISPIPVLSFTKTADAANVTASTSIGYTLTVNNSGAGAATAATLNDPLPAGTGISWSIGPTYSGPGTCAITGSVGSQTLSCSYGDLAAAASATVHVTSSTSVSSCAATYTNTATVMAGNSSSLQSSATTAVQCPGPLTILTVSVPAATQYQTYSTTLGASGGTPPYTWSVVSSTGVSLPEGMSLDPASGTVSATQVNGQGGYQVTVQVTDSATPTPGVVTQVLNFGVNSDTSFAGCQMFPADSIYNQPVNQLPVDMNPEHRIPSAYLTYPLHPDFGPGFYPAPGGIPWMRVAANQPSSNVNLANEGQIDPAGLYSWPFPPWPNAVVEGTSYGGAGPDHHILILETSTNSISGPQTGACTLYETYTNIAVPGMYNAGSNTWSLSAGVHYDLTSNEIAASADTLDHGAQDSTGVPMVPLLLRYSDVPLGAQHPLRMTFPAPTNWYVWPGTGCCTGSGPPQGLLYRLQASVNWQATCPVSTNPQAATVLQALQQYGAYMSDHGGTAYISGVPDVRWNASDLACLTNFSVNDLEVVDNSALEVSAVSGQTKPYVVPATLPVFVVGTAYSATISAVGGNPATRQLAISSGAMPPGLSLDPVAGTISGTPTSSAGNPYIFGVTATDTASGYSSLEQQFIIELTVLPVPDLTVVVSHSGNFATGQTGAMYSISVINAGTAPTIGTVTVVDTLPSGMTATAMSGAGWNCTVATVTCTRNDALPAGGSYPLSLTINIDYTPPFLVTDVATVSGGGEVNTANDQSADITLVFQYLAQTITFGTLSSQMLGAAPFPVSATASSGLPVSFNSQTTSVCMVSSAVSTATVTLVSVGICTIQATQAGGGNYNAAAEVNQSFMVTLESQTIDFGTLPGQVFGGAAFTVSATATSNLTVSFSSQTTSVCTVSGSTATLVGGGTCTIQATQAGSASYSAASPVNQSFTVSPESQTINFGTLPGQVYGAAPFTVSASATSNLTVSFTSLTISVCTVPVSGSTVTLVAGGVCTIQATQGGNASYSAATPVNQSFTVSPESQTINFAGLSNQVFGAAPFTVSATASSTLTVSFTSLTTSVCTVPVSGSAVTLLSGGTCTIQATQGGSASYSAATPVNQSFTVSPESQTIDFGTLSGKVYGASPFTVSASASSNLTVSFTSLTTSVCTVPVSGSTVTLVAGGTCTIQATEAGSASYSAATPVNQSFTVSPESQTINFAGLSNQVFGTAPFTVSATATSGLTVSFNSQTTSVCTVSGSTVTLVAGGMCTIQATQGGNASYSAGAPASQGFTVSPESQTINFGTLAGQVYGAAPFGVSGSATSNLTVSFNSQTTSVCTVSGSTVRLLSGGTCTVQATQAGSASYSAATPVNQSFTVSPESQAITFGTLAAQVYGAAPFTISASATSTQPVSFTSQTTSVCTVSGSTVTLLSGGTCTIQATQAGNASYSAAPAVSQSFTVTPESQTINFGTLAAQVYGAAPFTISASATSTQPVSFTSQTTSVCTVSGSTVTMLSGGTCTIQATQAGNASYSAAPAVSQSFTVTPESQAITFGPLPNEALGTAPFPVSASATSTQSVSFASTTSIVCTVSASTVTLLAIGTCTVQATQAGNASYSPASPVNQSFTVTAGLATPGAGSLNFANTIVGKSSATQTVTLQNSGNAPLTIASIAPAGSDAANYQYIADAIHPCPISPATLGAGASCTLDVAFVPVSQGAHNNAQIAIADNSGNVVGATQTIGLAGTGIALSSITISAANASLVYNTNEQFTATGTYSDSSTANLTGQVTWSSSAPGVAAIGAGGLATAVAAGQTNITAALSGVTSNSFQLTVLPGAPAGISVVSGSGQSATVGTAFAGQLQAVVKDGGGDAVPNASVTFTAPSSGAATTFANGTAFFTTTTDSSGIATSLTLTANATAGSYSVTAAVTGVTAAATYSLTNLKAPVLTITEASVGAFVQGQNATYAVTVGNAAGAGPTSGPVTVTEIVPNGLTLIAMSGGPTWNCSVPGSCTTNAVLNSGSTYPSITVTLSVAYNAPAIFSNQVGVSGGVSGGNSTTAAASDPTPIVSACSLTQGGSTSVTDVQQIIDEALGLAPAAHDLNGDGKVNLIDLQIVTNAVMGLGCSAS